MREIPAEIQEQIEEIRQKCSRLNPRVVIHSLAYNHGPYIREALDGFVNQRTDFPVVAVVHDDASTDNTAVILREYAGRYPNVILPIFESENQYSNPEGWLGEVMRLAMVASGASYIAMCECDDYWIDPLKLQKQVDFLEANPEYGMVYGTVQYYRQKEKRFGKIWGGDYVTFDNLWQKNTIPTLSTLFRRDLYVRYINDVKPIEQNWLMGDYPIWLWFAHESAIAFIPETIGVYRVLDNSASHSSNINKMLAFTQSGLDIKRFYNCFFHLGISEREFCYQEWFLRLRLYAVYSRFSDFCFSWFSGVGKHPSFLFRFRPYGLLLFFWSRKLRDARK